MTFNGLEFDESTEGDGWRGGCCQRAENVRQEATRALAEKTEAEQLAGSTVQVCV